MDTNPNQPSTQDAPRHPSTVALALLISLTLLAALLLGWLWYARYAPVHYDIGHGATLDDAVDARLLLPLILGAIALVALAWPAIWKLAGWQVTALPTAAGVIGLLALAAGGFQLWTSLTSGQAITIAPYLCDPGSGRPLATAGVIPAGCEPIPATAPMTIGTLDDPSRISGDVAGDSVRFPDLPPGTYRAALSTSVPPGTAEAILMVESGQGARTVATLSGGPDGAWSAPIALHPDFNRYILLLYPSPHAAAPDATITFTVQSCRGMSPASFDASACQPARISSPIVDELPLPQDPMGRPVSVAIEGNTVTLANLEARSYTFTPTIALVSATSPDGTILIIPASQPQVRENSVLQPGEAVFGAFTVEIDEQTGKVGYIVYVFPESEVLARATGPWSGVRP